MGLDRNKRLPHLRKLLIENGPIGAIWSDDGHWPGLNSREFNYTEQGYLG